MNTEVTYDTAAAAAYLGCSVSKVKYHLYTSEKLKPDGKHGPALYFTQETLDTFKGKSIKRGRPKGARSKVQYDD